MTRTFNFKNITTFFLLLIATIFSSCSEESITINESETGEAETKVSLTKDTDLTEFDKAWIKTDLASVLESGKDYTILAPTNQAFIDASIAVDKYNTDEEIEELKNILLNTIITKKVYKADFQELNYGYFNTLAVNKINNKNLSIFFNTEDAVTFNGVSSITAKFDIETDVALLHKVNKIVPTLTRKGFIDINPDLDLFKRMTDGFFDFLEVFVFKPELGATILAVTNDGFDGYIKEYKSEIENKYWNYDSLKDSHIANRILTLEDLKKPDVTFETFAEIEHFTTVKDGIVTIESSDWDVKGKILVADIQATNGIIHIIDKLLGKVIYIDFTKTKK